MNKVNGSMPTPRLSLSSGLTPARPAFHFSCLPETGATKGIMSADVANRYNVTRYNVESIKLTATHRREGATKCNCLVFPSVRSEVIIALPGPTSRTWVPSTRDSRS